MRRAGSSPCGGLLLSIAVACSPAPEPSPPPGPTVDTGPPVETPPAPAPTTSTTAVPTAPKIASAYRRAIGGEIPCGTAACKAGKEICCDSATARCVALPDKPAPQPPGGLAIAPPLYAAFEACGGVGTSLQEVRMCAHSGQCLAHDRCVTDPGWIEVLEVPFSYCATAEAAASIAERCESRDDECKAPGRHCVGNECRNAKASVGCGSATCGPRQLCWRGFSDPPGKGGQCAEKRPPDKMFRDDCDGPEDCVPGQYCCAGMFNRCLFGCYGGDTPVPICANHQRCTSFEPGACDACGAQAK